MGTVNFVGLNIEVSQDSMVPGVVRRCSSSRSEPAYASIFIASDPGRLFCRAVRSAVAVSRMLFRCAASCVNAAMLVAGMLVPMPNMRAKAASGLSSAKISCLSVDAREVRVRHRRSSAFADA